MKTCILIAVLVVVVSNVIVGNCFVDVDAGSVLIINPC